MSGAAPSPAPLRILQLYPKQDYFTGAAIQLRELAWGLHARGSWQARRFGSAWFHLDLPRHRSHFTAAGLERLLRAAGFEQIELSTATTADGLAHSLEYRRWGRRRFRTGLARYAWTALWLALQPVLALVHAGGDELGASARR